MIARGSDYTPRRPEQCGARFAPAFEDARGHVCCSPPLRKRVHQNGAWGSPRSAANPGNLSEIRVSGRLEGRLRRTPRPWCGHLFSPRSQETSGVVAATGLAIARPSESSQDRDWPKGPLMGRRLMPRGYPPVDASQIRGSRLLIARISGFPASWRRAMLLSCRFSIGGLDEGDPRRC